MDSYLAYLYVVPFPLQEIFHRKLFHILSFPISVLETNTKSLPAFLCRRSNLRSSRCQGLRDFNKINPTSLDAIAKYKLEKIVLGPKEGLGLVNGTAFSASAGS